MKKLSVLIISVLIFFTFSFSASAEESYEKYGNEQIENSGIYTAVEELDDTTKEILYEMGLNEIKEQRVFSLSLSSFLDSFKNIASDVFGEILKAFSVLIGTVLLSALINSAYGGALSRFEKIMNYAPALMVILSVIVPFGKCVSEIGSAINTACGFCICAVPILCVLLAVGGKATSAVAFNGMAGAVSQVISGLCVSFFLPFSNILAGAGLCSGIESGFPVNKIIATLRKYLSLALGICASLYFSVLGIKSAVASAADSVTIRAAKLFVGNFVPVIGGALSDSVNTVISYIDVTKSVIGGFAVITVIVIFMPAFIKTALWLICFEASALFAGVFGLKNIENILKNISSAVSVLLIIMVFVLLMLIINLGILTIVKGTV